MSYDPEFIHVRGARQNNLKDVEVRIPTGTLTAVTGLSGAGKSSLAFQTLYAEGQRRYVESFSTYARQFLERMDRPDVDEIEGVLPSIAIDQKAGARSARSTVGTMSEISDYLKVLWARAATLYCEGCGEPVAPDTPAAAAARLLETTHGARALVAFPVRGATPASLVAEGWLRGIRGGRDVPLDEAPRDESEALWVVADRVRVLPERRGRLVGAFEVAFRRGEGRAAVWTPGEAESPRRDFTTDLRCAACDIAYAPANPNLFSFNSPVGACPTCNGFGRVIGVDPELVVPDARLSIAQGAVRPWQTGKSRRGQRKLLQFCEREGIPTEPPWAELSEEDRRAVFAGGKGFRGVDGWFRWLEGKKYKMHVRVFLARYRAYRTCEDCGGKRLRPEALRHRLGGLDLAAFLALDVAAARGFVDGLSFPPEVAKSVAVPLGEIQARLGYLAHIGVGYLSLDRASRTLSGGEAQRVDLTRAVGTSLVNTLFVLDEPSVGLHPRDTGRLIEALGELTRRGNTVVVVEHDAELIRRAERVIELGPAAGEGGGRIVFDGAPAELAARGQTPTAAVLRGELGRSAAAARAPRPDLGRLLLRGARGHNLKGVDLSVPFGAMTVVSGVSGSGKSSLVEGTLYRALRRAAGQPTERPLPHDALEGAEGVDEVVLLDQQPASTSSRANPVTYMKAYDALRKVFAEEPEAVARGLSAGDFSFNTAGGRCEACEGTGFERVEMQFLSDVQLPCEACGGTRFSPEVRRVRHEGLSIDQVLALSVDEALLRFADLGAFAKRLAHLQRVGLGYVRLGQPLSTLSGGENQRLRLAGFFASKRQGHTLFLCDEPTTGLHGQDVARLLDAFRRIVEGGDTLLVIEHHPEVVAAADQVVDLGPEGGAEGGRVLVAGPPERVAACADSHTGRALRERGQPPPPALPARAPREDGAVIRARGVRVHNLRDIDVDIPRGRFVVVTGPSGSGKSSLAFNVLFAEGQRRYLDCLSPYARQFVREMERPDLDELSALPPAVAIEQRSSRGGVRATVSTATELAHYLRLLFARLGTLHCTSCGRPVHGLDETEVAARIGELVPSGDLRLLAPVVRGRKGFHKEAIARARRLGHRELRVDGAVRPLEGLSALERHGIHDVDLVVARLQLPDDADSLAAPVAEAMALGAGTAVVLSEDGREWRFSRDLYCAHCDLGFDPPDPPSLSFHTTRGRCPVCEGAGVDPTLPEDAPEQPCPACEGTRLNRRARAVVLGARDLGEAQRVTPGGLMRWLDELPWTERQRRIAEGPLREIRQRVEFLEEVGVGYLRLDRALRSLSGGESQRLRLAAQLAAQLSGALYVLDEPTIGLHPIDNERLLRSLRRLTAHGNTVVVVEHDEETMRAADHIIDLGPGGGREGGRVVAAGDVAQLMADPASSTGRLLAGEASLGEFPRRPLEGVDWLRVEGARKHNLRDLDVRFPVGRFSVVTGVSGSGKSTLVREVLLGALRARLGGGKLDVESCRAFTGGESIGRVAEVDALPIGRTPRSTPATYVKAWDGIRGLFAALPESRARGYRAARFSFNVKGGRCPECEGQGARRLEMSFLPEVFVTCAACGGDRFTTETLVPRYRERSIAEVLRMTVAEAAELFAAVPVVHRPLELMVDVGLGYLSMGQPSNTLSGGEAERVKLVWELARPANRPTLYVLDEPSVGLHWSDLGKLARILQRLVDAGHTLVLIEHHPDIMALADYMVDLGPGGGEQGGALCYAGPPDPEATGAQDSPTLKFLRQTRTFSKGTEAIHSK